MQKHFKLLWYYLLIFLLTFGLKYHYSRANSEQLGWILAPTAGMVEMLSDMAFEREAGEGYINYEHALIIAPSCAGVNFLIAAFCMAGFSFLHLFEGRHGRLSWLLFSLFASYLLTISVNAIRILLSMFLYQADFMPIWFSPEQIHRLEGVVVYFLFLSLYYLLLDAIMKMDFRLRGNDTGTKLYKHWNRVKKFSPLFWYLCIALFVPFIHQAYRKEFQLSFEHIQSVVATCLAIFIFLSAAKICCQKLLKVDKVERVP
ncbi:MAG: exosortase K [bacterium]|nr:exosortase K [bacterium]